jgi:gluconate 5-dehydrogenase
MAQLSGTRVLVTGGTSGPGRAMAQALAQAGARVVVTSRRRQRPQRTAAQLGAGALGVELDVRDASWVSAAVDSVYGMLDGLDVLVNNAGIGMRTVNPAVHDRAAAILGSAARRLARRAGDQGDRDIPGRPGGSAANAERWRRTSGHDLDERADDDPPRLHPLRTLRRRRGGPAARVMAADLANTPVTANILLPGGATATGMIPDEMVDEMRANLLDPAIMGPPIVWLASPDAAGVHDERIVARDFDDWLDARTRTNL